MKRLLKLCLELVDWLVKHSLKLALKLVDWLEKHSLKFGLELVDWLMKHLLKLPSVKYGSNLVLQNLTESGSTFCFAVLVSKSTGTVMFKEAALRAYL